MATARDASELKQQGALEAARDPESSVTADDAQKKIVEESKKAGVTAFTFDPDATPEQKKAQARAVRCLPPPSHSPTSHPGEGCPNPITYSESRRYRRASTTPSV